MMNFLKINTSNLAHWANTIRILENSEKERFLDSLWSGQLESKSWLVNTLSVCLPQSSVNIYIFGGWTGILANMILQDERINIIKIRSIDIDPWCELVADSVNKIYEMDDWKFKAVTGDMSTYQYQTDIIPHVVINTSTEHVSQSVYDEWYQKIPSGTLVVVQGNNFFSCNEHIRCSENLENFIKINHVVNPIYSSSLPTDMYDRFMCIWRK